MVEIRKCNICGQMVGVIKKTGAPLVCCGVIMEEVIAGTGDGANEKHVPYVTMIDNKHASIQIGEILHPSSELHHIEWIIVETNLRTIRYPLNAFEEPKRVFELALNLNEMIINVYENCNLHGLYKWSAK